MSVINTNVKSLVASNAINMNDSRLSQAMQRLSTGSRINAAKDDAAGLAIGTRMDAQIRGIKMGIENANTANSLLQTAEGAMDVVNSALQRMRELAVQASNGANTDQDRAALDIEVQQLKDQIDTIASKTTFNGINLLDGSFKNKLMLIGDKAADVMSLSVGSVNTASLGASAPLSKGVMVSGRVNASSADFPTSNILINGTAINAITANSSAPAGGTKDIADVVAAINSSNLGVSASAFNEVVAETKGSGVSAAGKIQITVTANDTGTKTVISLGATTSLDDVVKQINLQGGEATVLAKLNDQGKLVLYNNSGATISLIGDSVATNDSDPTGLAAMGFDSTLTSIKFNGFMKVASDNGSNFSVEIDGGTAANYTALGLANINSEGVVTGGKITGSSVITPADWTPGSLSINGVDIWYTGVGNDITETGGTAQTTANEIVRIINKFSDRTGVTAGLAFDSDGDPSLTLKSTDNSPIQIKLSETFKGAGNKFGLVETNVAAADYDTNPGSLAGYAGGKSVAAMDVLSQSNALNAIAVLDGALNMVSVHRANIGAYQNRLQSSINNLSNMVTNTEASRSRIMDADYATETTNLARSQIIQQAATAMLAQANQSAQTVLTLLK